MNDLPVILDNNGHMTKLTPTYKSVPHGVHRFEHGIHFLYLEGSWEDMAEAHGRLLLPEIRKGLVPFFEGFIERHMAHGVLGGQSARLRRLVAGVVEAWIANPIDRAMPEEQKKAVVKLAEVCGYSQREVARVLSVPDAAAILGALLAESRNRTLQGIAVGVPACSAVVLGAPHTKNGHLLHGRNLDYDCLGTWDTQRVVSFNKPSNGIGHVSFTTAGAFTSGLTGLNEEGISLGCNVSGTWDVHPGGMPFHAVHTRILSEAHNLDEALAIVASHPRASGFNLHLADGKTGEACVVEYSAHHHAVRWLHEGRLMQTNHYQTEHMQQYKMDHPPHAHQNTIARLNRLDALSSDLRDAEPTDVLAMLRDRFDEEENRHRPFGHIVACSKNVQASVVDATAQKAWVSSGQAPAMDTDFVGFDLQQHLKDPHSKLEILPLPYEDPLTPESRESIRFHQKSYMACIHHNDLGSAAELMKEAMKLDPRESGYPIILAALNLRLGKPEEARQAALRAIPLQKRPFLKALSMTLLGWANDLDGNREGAKNWYAKSLETVGDQSPALTEENQQRMKKPFTSRDAAVMRIDYLEPGVAGF